MIRSAASILAFIACAVSTAAAAADSPLLARGAGGAVFDGPWGQSMSRNLTPHPTGLKNWTDAEIARAVRDGIDRSGQPYRPPMAFPFYKNINDADMSALIAYLRSLKPQPPGANG